MYDNEFKTKENIILNPWIKLNHNYTGKHEHKLYRTVKRL